MGWGKMAGQDLEEAINTLTTGSAICFLGSGFSAFAKDQNGRSIPSVDELIGEICTLVGIERPEGASLSDLSDFCQGNNELAPKLNVLLIDRLTHCVPSPDQLKILLAPWRSIFTTNFDDLAERAHPAGAIQIVTPTTDAKTIVSNRLPIYYLHGRALDLLESKHDASIVLSESNYLELKSKNANLHSTFLNELHCANKVFFIGYSLRDMEIAKRLFAISDTLQSKSVVICGPKEGPIAQARLKKFGSVHAVGLDGLAKAFPADFKQLAPAQSVDRLAFVQRQAREPAAGSIEREDIDRLIISGEFDYAKFGKQANSTDSHDLYCVKRDEKTKEVFDAVAPGMNRFVVSSDIGNGKTVFLEQLSYAAHGAGYEVFRVSSQLPEMFKELEYLLGLKSLQMFIIDDLVRNAKAAEFIGDRLPKTSVLVCGARETSDTERVGALATTLGGAIREIDLNLLSSAELRSWEALLERWGYWEGRIALDAAARFNFLRNDCGAENRSIVVSVFGSSQIAAKINSIVSYFLKSKPEHLKAFVAILICSLCQKHVEWDRVVQWLDIDEHQLKTDLQRQAVFNFMTGRREWHKLTSPQLADHIFRKYDFDDSILVEVYSRIVRETASGANDPRSGFDSRENLKELMKFRFLTRIFGDGPHALASIKAIYARLSAVPRIRDNDQFWLQYAMSSIERGDTETAEEYIETAMGIAKKKGANYSDHQIRDQRARVLLLKNAKKKGNPDAAEIVMALGDLETTLGKGGTVEKIHPVRSAEYILRLVEEKELSHDLRQRVLATLELMDKTMTSIELKKAKKGEVEMLRKSIRDATNIVKSA